jgi:PmbA protein
MIKNDKYKLARWAVETALKKGAQEAKVSISDSKSSKVSVRDEKIDVLEQANRNSLQISLYVDQKYSSHSTNRLNNKEELTRFIEEAVAGTRFLSEDEFRTLPDPDLYYSGGEKDLKTFDHDFDALDPQKKIEYAFALEKEVLGSDDRIISVTGNFSDSLNEMVMVTSNGFEGDRQSTNFSLWATVAVKSGDARPSSYWSESSIFHKDLISQDIGKKALERALKKLGQEKISSGKMPMIVENKVMASSYAPLLSPVINALNGRSIQQKNSFLIDKKGEKIASSNLNITEDPFIVSGRGSRLFDGEGLALKKREVISKGVLKEYFIDTYYGKKLGIKPTSSDITNLLIKAGNKDLHQMISSLDRGIFVTDFNGGNANGSTGDFSYGIEGFLIEKGVPVQAISEMNITGNLKVLWNDFVAAGSDVYENSSWRMPSLMFDNVDFSGT